MKDLFGNQKIMALSWKEPYASLMLHGKIETRTWNTNYRGLVLICASKKTYNDQQVRDISGWNNYERIFVKLDYYLDNHITDYLGKAIAIGELVDSRPMRKEDEDLSFVQFYPDLFCHVYKNVQPIKPFDWKGTQGWKQ